MTRSSTIDLRSDTITRPNAGMRAAMASAEVGDDVYGDDRTTLALEARVADLLGKQSGLFFPSGTQSNLCAMMVHCARGDEVITGEHYHVFGYEARGASVLGGIAMHPLVQLPGGGIDPARIAGAIKQDDAHFPTSRLLSLENSHYGQAIALDTSIAMASAGRSGGLAVHLDGARLANAAIALGLSLEGACDYADTVSFCLSKGLGAPAGSVLVGPKPFIDRARRLRKMLGGGMRQVGILAAAGNFALDHHLPTIARDHQAALALSNAIVDRDCIRVIRPMTQTNMLYLTLPQGGFARLQTHLAKKSAILISGDDTSVRLVVHHDISDSDIAVVAEAMNQWTG